MKDQWLGNNVNLNLLTRGINQFFTQSQFETKLEQIENGYKIEAVTKKILSTQLKITVDIKGQPNDFTINYTTDENNKRLLSSPLARSLTWALGGGIFILKEEKAREALKKFENTFWNYIDEKITQLTRNPNH